MDKEIVEIIKKQSGETDEVEIEKMYLFCNNDISDTILKLSKIVVADKPVKRETFFDKMRTILDEKATIFQNINKTI
jgi:hypothetical protein